MTYMKRFIVNHNSRGFKYKNNRFEKILEPGSYYFLNLFNKATVDFLLVKNPEVVHPDIDILYREYTEQLQKDIVKVHSPKSIVTAVYSDMNLIDIVPEGRVKYYWKHLHKITTEEIDILEQPFVPDHLISSVSQHSHSLSPLIKSYTIEYGHKGLLLKDEKIISHLNPGSYYIWNFTKGIRVETINTRLDSLEIVGQEMITKDTVTIRCNALIEFEVKHVLNLFNTYSNYKNTLKQAAQLLLREYLETRTLDELLENKNKDSVSMLVRMREIFDENIITIHSFSIKDIILPGEMRQILSKVVLAQKNAQANLITRREETAATRSLLNTARLMENNPVLMRLKELEALENVVKKVETLNITKGLDGLMELVKIGNTNPPKKAK